ncbi:hypothetical protein NC653_028576 [Populus alba x Populus x berolinensis]|uniref:Uncharacterized protein n=1 Tax=Populus alba x Populus x berolinensis TaxID=444605 RepID=A0AAD6M0E1_9ROSI|nr:hypothetical protein NC653_028576 [Populus alba x Populus x berolinensis]
MDLTPMNELVKRSKYWYFCCCVVFLYILHQGYNRSN